MAADERLGATARDSLVAPFYLKLMGAGAIRADGPLLRSVGRSSRNVTDDQVRLMLQGTWRPLVMGAWYAIARNDVTLTGPVHDALETCLGNLTSPALITATLFYPSKHTIPLLEDYADTDRASHWGQADFADAAARHLTGAEPPRTDPAAEPAAGAEPPRTDPAAEPATAQLGALLRRGSQLRWLHASER